MVRNKKSRKIAGPKIGQREPMGEITISEPTEILFRRCSLEWERGNYFFVMDLLKKNIPSASPPFTMEEFMSTSLQTILDERIANAFEKRGVFFVRDFVEVRSSDLLTIPGFSHVTVNAIRTTLQLLHQRVVE